VRRRTGDDNRGGLRRRLLGDHLGAAGVVTGEDFTFGKGRTGTVALLAAEGARHGIAARTVGPVSEGRLPVSSSRIRDALKAGECETATRLMTRPFAIRAIVQHGDKRGRAIGFPTANLDMGHYLRPRYGIYAVTGRVLDSGQELKGAASLGVRPTFDPPKELLEPYFFDFDGDLYGREVEGRAEHFLRPEAKFDSVEALQAQMAKTARGRRSCWASPSADSSAGFFAQRRKDTKSVPSRRSRFPFEKAHPLRRSEMAALRRRLLCAFASLCENFPPRPGKRTNCSRACPR
jgi:riboflavin kinase/FMN adenylyltransferase